MQIIGELINASRKSIGEAIKAGDAETVADIARKQHENGADFVDVNAGIFVGQEAEYLEWLVKTVQEEVEDIQCSIDSADPEGVEAALAVHKGTAMINSISLEKKRYDPMMNILAGTDLKVIALCMSDEGMPESADDRVQIADKLVNNLVNNGVPVENIYIDPLVQPISTSDTYGMEFLDAIERITTEFPGIHTACGLSNVSYGLPGRKILNQTFMALGILKGLDGAIINPLDKRMVATIKAAEALTAKDEGCMNYLDAYRNKMLEV